MLTRLRRRVGEPHPFRLLADEAERWADELPTRYDLTGAPFERSLLDFALDVYAEVGWRVTRARIASDRGAGGDARALVVGAVEKARTTDNVNLLAGALVALAEVGHATERHGRADTPTTPIFALVATPA